MASLDGQGTRIGEGRVSAADSEMVILVDRDDRETGVAPKLQAHRDAQLHRAFSVFVFNRRGEALLQRRARDKYHSGGLWSNTCCGHPRPGEETAAAARRRLREEMRVDCELQHVASIYYRLEVSNGLREHELDHVFAGQFEGAAQPDPREIEDVRWMSVESLRAALQANPDAYTPWLGVILPQLEDGRLLPLDVR